MDGPVITAGPPAVPMDVASAASGALLTVSETNAARQAIRDRNDAELHRVCERVKAARGGRLPSDWMSKVLCYSIESDEKTEAPNSEEADAAPFGTPATTPVPGAAGTDLEERYAAAAREAAKARFLRDFGRMAKDGQADRARPEALSRVSQCDALFDAVAGPAPVLASAPTAWRQVNRGWKRGPGNLPESLARMDSRRRAAPANAVETEVEAIHRTLVSKREVHDISGFTKRLVNGIKCKTCKGAKKVEGKRCVECRGVGGRIGIMRQKDTLGRTNEPRAHQVDGVRDVIAHPERPVKIFLWDPGMGKTAGVLLTVCMKKLALNRVPRTVIVVPSNTLDQWEDALHDWLRVPESEWIVTNVGKKLTREVLERKSIVVTTAGIVYMSAWRSCFYKKQQHHQIQTAAGQRWVSGYSRKEGTSLHPLFGTTDASGRDTPRVWDIAAIDEVHTFRNDECDQTHAISKLTETSALRIGLTGTMIFNHPRDMRGQALALNVPDNFMERNKWVLDRAGRRVRPESVREFHAKFVHRARSTELNLPDTVHEAITYAVQLPPDAVPAYEQGRQSACNLRMQMQRSGRVDAQQLRQLMAMIGGLQQFLVSPRLAEYSAPDFEANAALYDEAAAEPTGAFYALQDELLRMRDEGHRKIVVSCCHVQMMEIVARWMRRTAPELGEIVVYKGKLSRPQRLKVKKTFLRPGAEGVLFLSVGAGGTGLHLVPGPEGMIFWGSSPFAPAQVEQTACRINRIGQTCPLTGKVTVRHLVPYGGIDYAIRRTHRDKRKLMLMCQENEWAPGDEHNGEWRRARRIIDSCLPLNPDGNFSEMPAFGVNAVEGEGGEAGEAGESNEPSTVVPNMQTRGYGEPSDVASKRQKKATFPRAGGAGGAGGAAEAGSSSTDPVAPTASATGRSLAFEL